MTMNVLSHLLVVNKEVEIDLKALFILISWSSDIMYIKHP